MDFKFPGLRDLTESIMYVAGRFGIPLFSKNLLRSGWLSILSGFDGLFEMVLTIDW